MENAQRRLLCDPAPSRCRGFERCNAGCCNLDFKLYGSSLAQDRQDLTARLMGTHGAGWEGDGFSRDEVGATRSWLSSRAVTIYGGTNEVQCNIIAKRVLGLPD